MNLGKCSPLNAELWGFYKGLELTWGKDFKKVCVESGSLIAVNKVYANQQWALVEAIKRPMRQDWEVKSEACIP